MFQYQVYESDWESSGILARTRCSYYNWFHVLSPAVTNNTRYVVTLVVRSRATHLQNKTRGIKSLRSAGISLLLTPAPLKSHTNIKCIQYRTNQLTYPASLEKSIQRNHKAYLINIRDNFAPGPPATSHSLPLVQNYRSFPLEFNKWLTKHTGVSPSNL